MYEYLLPDSGQLLAGRMDLLLEGLAFAQQLSDVGGRLGAEELEGACQHSYFGWDYIIFLIVIVGIAIFI